MDRENLYRILAESRVVMVRKMTWLDKHLPVRRDWDHAVQVKTQEELEILKYANSLGSTAHVEVTSNRIPQNFSSHHGRCTPYASVLLWPNLLSADAGDEEMPARPNGVCLRVYIQEYMLSPR